MGLFGSGENLPINPDVNIFGEHDYGFSSDAYLNTPLTSEIV